MRMVWLITCLLTMCVSSVFSAPVAIRFTDNRVSLCETQVRSWTSFPCSVLLECETTNTIQQTLDSSGNGNNASNINGAVWTVCGTNQYGRVEHCYSFDYQASQYLLCNSIAYSATTISFGAWVYITALENGFNGAILSQWDSPPTQNWLMFLGEDSATTNVTTYIFQSNGSVITSPKVGLATNGWHHVCAVADGSKVRMFLDAVESGNGTAYDGTIRNNSIKTMIGALNSPGYPTYFWRRYIDDAFVVPYALSYSQITNLYLNTRPTNNVRTR